jgi:hypothetical protein
VRFGGHQVKDTALKGRDFSPAASGIKSIRL